MRNTLAPLLGCFSLLYYLLNTILWFIPIILLALIKFCLPQAQRTDINATLNWCANTWCFCNSRYNQLCLPTQWHIQLPAGINQHSNYLIIANHQSWVDVLVLQQAFTGKAPFLKFFLKQILIWLPMLGQAWWALDMPFMKRYSKAQVQRNPDLKGKDIETTRRSCEKFKDLPLSMVNFVEGTRFTASKHQHQQSPFTHLLKPRAGGIAFALQVLDQQLHQMLDVTICYPNGQPSFWQFASGRLTTIQVEVQLKPIDASLKGDYLHDPQFKAHFQQWLNQVWLDKDQLLNKLKQKR